VVIGNPPYQRNDKETRQANLGKSLWTDFLHKSFNIVSDNGCVALITPKGWMSPGSSALQHFQQRQVLWIDANTVDQHFPQIGSTFSAFVIKNAPVTTSTKITDKSGATIEVSLQNVPYFPALLSAVSLSILGKTTYAPNPKLCVKASYELHSDRKHLLSKTVDDKHIYRVFHTNAQEWYSSQQHSAHTLKKVVFSRSGSIQPKYDANCGVTEAGFYIEVGSEQEGVRLVGVLNSKLYQFITKISKWSGFNVQPVLMLLPSVPLTALWTDAQLYKHFKLTQEEIDLIEATVK